MLWKIILSGLLLVVSFPSFNLSFLAFIGFVPLFFAVENKSPKKAFLISFITGFIFYLGVLYWLYHVTIAGLVVLCLYLAIYFGIFGIIINRFGVLIAPIAWVALEYIQAHLSIMGFGWVLLGYSQYKNTALIQIADFSGVYGVSFVIMLVNAVIWHVIARLRSSRSNPNKKIALSAFGLFAMTALILATSYAYGFFRLNEKQGTNSLKISVIQGNIPQELKWNPKAQHMIIQKYIALTKMAALDSPNLIVWPETSFPGFFEIDKEMTDEVLNLAKDIKIPILAGVNTESDDKYFNSAVLISSEGEMAGKYDKIHLVPFGEYVPFSSRFPALHKFILGELGEFTPGREFKIFEINTTGLITTIKFAALICFEDIFPELSRRFVKDGAKFLIVITNDAWYGKSSAAYQHAACSVFRAIENRVPVVRSANTGYSCFIDSRGRIYDSVEEKKSHLFITGYKTSTLLIN